MPWIANDNQRREVVEIIAHVKETADQLNEALSRLIEAETDVLQVKTSISSQALDYMPEERLREEVLRNQASQLAISIMKHLETVVEKDTFSNTTIYTTTIGIKVPQTSKGTLE
jgi:hypothetical protein